MQDAPLEYFEEDFVEAEPETVLLVDESTDGSLRVTGMMQSFRLDGGFEDPNQLLDRPRTSFLDVTWSSWCVARLPPPSTDIYTACPFLRPAQQYGWS